MRQDFKEKLCSALRSDRFIQAKNYLVLDGVPPEGEPCCACCLGVAIILAMEEGLKLDTEIVDLEDGYEAKVVKFNEQLYELPQTVCDWIKVGNNRRLKIYMKNEEVKELHDGERFTNLDALNDRGVPFSEIADLIEKYF